jgi:hypothetical protein
MNPLIPIVRDTIREYFWTDLLRYLDQQYALLVAVYMLPGTTDGMRGVIYDMLVIWACGVHDAKIDLGDGIVLQIPRDVIPFVDADLPILLDTDSNATYVPTISNYKAYDLLWKIGKYIIGVQVHTSEKENRCMFGFQ